MQRFELTLQYSKLSFSCILSLPNVIVFSFRYYLNKVDNCRISVAELNSIIANSLQSLDLNKVSLDIAGLTDSEICSRYAAAVEAVTKHAVSKIVIDNEQIIVLLNKPELTKIITEAAVGIVPTKTPQAKFNLKITDKTDYIEIIAHIAFRRYAGRKIAYSADGNAISISRSNHDEALVSAIAKSYKWNKMLDSGAISTRNEIAKIENMDKDYVGDILKLKYLSPEIVTLIMKGAQPRTLKLSHLTHQKLPLDWNEQKTLLNIA